jgi:hypothetical protein
MTEFYIDCGVEHFETFETRSQCIEYIKEHNLFDEYEYVHIVEILKPLGGEAPVI